jgi:archaellum component FlaF (FlaF/FlaG flagellin family)
MVQKVIQIRLVGVVLSLLIALLVVGGLLYHRTTKRLYSELDEANSRIKFYQIVVSEQVESVSETKLQLRQAKRDIELSQEQVERLKEMNVKHVLAIGELKLQVTSYRDSLTLWKDVDTTHVVGEVWTLEGEDKNVVEVPLRFGSETQWSKAVAKIDIDGNGSISYQSKEFPIDVTLGYRGFFNRSYVAAVSTPNPEVAVTQNQFQIVHKRPKVWPYVLTTTVGFVAGVWVMSK